MNGPAVGISLSSHALAKERLQFKASDHSFRSSAGRIRRIGEAYIMAVLDLANIFAFCRGALTRCETGSARLEKFGSTVLDGFRCFAEVIFRILLTQSGAGVGIAWSSQCVTQVLDLWEVVARSLSIGKRNRVVVGENLLCHFAPGWPVGKGRKASSNDIDRSCSACQVLQCVTHGLKLRHLLAKW